MVYVVLSAVGTLIALVGLVRAMINEAGFLRARRSGMELQAEVTGNGSSPVGSGNAQVFTPVVRYAIEGRTYQAEVANSSGIAGSGSMTIVVNPEHPRVPYDRYGGLGRAGRGSIAVFALTAVNLAAAIAILAH
jgi:hypothetical protein